MSVLHVFARAGTTERPAKWRRSFESGIRYFENHDFVLTISRLYPDASHGGVFLCLYPVYVGALVSP